MKIICPKCKTEYLIDQKITLKKNVKLKCFDCSHTWVQKEFKKKDQLKKSADNLKQKINSTIKNQLTDNAPVEEKNDIPDPSFTIDKERKNNSLSFFIFFLIIFSTFLFISIYFKENLINSFPEIKKIYSIFKIENKKVLNSLEFSNLEKKKNTLSDGSVVIKIFGTIKNKSEFNQKIPKLRGTLLDNNNNILSTWFFTAEEMEAFPNETVKFNTSYIHNDENISDIKIDFYIK